jgi:hypothetical protein
MTNMQARLDALEQLLNATGDDADMPTIVAALQVLGVDPAELEDLNVDPTTGDLLD